MMLIAIPAQRFTPTSLQVWGLPDPHIVKIPTRNEVDTHLGNMVRTGGLKTEWLWEGLDRWQFDSLNRLADSSNTNGGIYFNILGENFTSQWYLGVMGKPEYTPLPRVPNLLQNVTVRVGRMIPLDEQTTLTFEAGIDNDQTIELDLLDADTLIDADGIWGKSGSLSFRFPSSGTKNIVLRHLRGKLISRFQCNIGLWDIPQSLLVHPLEELVVPMETLTSLPYDLRTKTTLKRLVLSHNAITTADLSLATSLNEIEMTNCFLSSLTLPTTAYWKTFVINDNPALASAGNWMDRVWVSRSRYQNVGIIDIRSTGLTLSGDYVGGATHTDKGKLYSLVNDYGWSVQFDG